jgi:hypothetical protein
MPIHYEFDPHFMLYSRLLAMLTATSYAMSKTVLGRLNHVAWSSNSSNIVLGLEKEVIESFTVTLADNLVHGFSKRTLEYLS